MKKTLIVLLGVVLAAVAFTPVQSAEVSTNTFYLKEDSAKSVWWRIGDSAGSWTGAVVNDFDTSAVMEMIYPNTWENITAVVKSYQLVRTAPGDSGAVTVILQQSNDNVIWKPLDSLIVADSLSATKNFTVLRMRYGRFIVHDGAKCAFATGKGGVRVQIGMTRWGRKTEKP